VSISVSPFDTLDVDADTLEAVPDMYLQAS
jgi:hypothetical protein